MVARKTTKKKPKGNRGVTRRRADSRQAGKGSSRAKRPSSRANRRARSTGKAARAPGGPKSSKGRKAGRPGRRSDSRRPPLSAKVRASKASPGKAKPKRAAQATKAKSARQHKASQALRDKERAQLQKRREKEKRERERARALAQKQREKEKRERERARALAQKQREKEKREREKARARAQKAREKEAIHKRRERERLRAQQALERQRRQREQAAAREAARRAREEERERKRRDREEAKRREQEERERAREEVRRKKEEERARKEAEREAYRKAKEEERERLRAEKEAARRALEGKIARANRRAQRAAGLGRASTTRVYRPDAIPDQSGTTRRAPQGVSEEHPIVARPPVADTPPPTPPPTPAEEPPPPAPERVEDRYALIRERLQALPEPFQREYHESFDMSWIHHDSALEGVVYTFQELKTALDPTVTVVPDSSLQPVCEEIRRHKAGIELVRELAEKKRVPVNVDLIKRIYLTLHPSEGDLKSVKYRKDIPQHRLYFHEYAPPDKIAYKVRQVVDWLNGPEPKKIKHPVRIAARVHYDLLRVFPFPIDSGKVARLLMNLLLLRAGYPPAIVHSTERQRYYEALRGSLPTIVAMINESIENGLSSVEKRLEEEARRLRTGTA